MSLFNPDLAGMSRPEYANIAGMRDDFPPRDVFTYGSLMFPQVWRRVVGGRHASLSATLAGYARFAVRDETYPGMVAQTGGSVEGVMYRNVSGAELAALDRFEGPEYRRIEVRVDTAQGPLPALAYLYIAAPRLTGLPWDPAGFPLQQFMNRHCPPV